VTTFETETMAELCVKQGLVSEGLAIYRRLVIDAPDEQARARLAERLSELQRIAQGAVAARARAENPAPRASTASGAPTLTLERLPGALLFAWSLPPETLAPALQILLMRRGPAGVETETRTVPLDAACGRTTIDAPALYAVRAAVGWLDGARFVPLARLPDGGP
jgi:hypothetical protein